MSIQQNFPSTRPSLNLNFARSQKLDPRITFTRTSSATRVNGDGLIEVVSANSPRFDFDPISGESLGLLVEEQRTNLLLRSEEFDNSYWGKTRASIVPNVIIAPDGTLTADKLVENTEFGPHHVNRIPFSFTNGVSYTLSGYYKAAERTRIIMQLGNNGAPFPSGGAHAGSFDLATGLVIAAGTSLTSATIAPVGDGWYRCSITAVAQATATDTIFVAFLVESTNTFSYAGDGTSGIYIWGAQLEQGSFPTSYIPTTTSTVTRTADNASITGSNFSDFYNPSEGTIYTVFRKSLGTQTNQYPFAISDNTVNNRFTLFTSGSSTLNFRLLSSGSSFNPSNLSFTAGEPIKASIASAVGTNQSIASSTGVLSTPGSPTSMPLVDRMYVGGAHSGLEKLNGTISQLIYYSSRLPNDQLITLTK
jgi:hypothetical protein